jgi:TonB family protein
MTSIWFRDLVAFALQIGIVAGAGGAVAWALGIRAPRVALGYWQAVLLACLLLPFCQPWQETLPPVTHSTARVLSAGDNDAAAAAAPIAAASPALSGGAWIVLALSAGIAVRLLWLTVGACKLRQLRRSASPLEPLPATFLGAQERLGTRAEIGLSAGASGPITFGLRRPMVLLPPAFLTMPPHVQEAIAYHELLHVRRRDWLYEIGEEGIRTIFWWHPAVWWLIGRIQLAREQVVDQTTIDITRAREQYVDALLLVALAKSPTTLVPAPLFLRKSLLKQRVAQIFQETTMTTRRLITSLAASAVALALAATVAVYAFPLQSEGQASNGEPVEILNGGDHLLHGSVPEYPKRAAEQRVAGDVVLEVTLDERGEVSDTRVVSGPDELRKAAIEAVLNWHFSPEKRQSTTMTVTLRFRPPTNVGKEGADGEKYAFAWKAEDSDKRMERAKHVMEELERAMADPAVTPEMRDEFKHRYMKERLLVDKILVVDKIREAGTIGPGPSPDAPMTLTQIRNERVQARVVQDLIARAGISVGDTITEDTMKRVREIAATLDEHLRVDFHANGKNGVVMNVINP